MLNRKNKEETVDVDGYGHIIKNNLSLGPRTSGRDINVNQSLCEISNNSFLSAGLSVSQNDFVSMDETQLTAPRKADGSLPDIDFLKPKQDSRIVDAGTDVGLPYKGTAPDLGCFETEAETTRIFTPEDNKMKVWVENKTLIIDAEKASWVRTYTINGFSNTFQIAEGRNGIRLNEGLYIVELNGHKQKVLIK